MIDETMKKIDLDYIQIHHSPCPCGIDIIFYKGKEYTKDEYDELIKRKQRIKDTIHNIMVVTLLSVFVAYRAYVYFEYGI